ncbi:hypothetical protein ACLOJK_011555 [Asimina triloba]
MERGRKIRMIGGGGRDHRQPGPEEVEEDRNDWRRWRGSQAEEIVVRKIGKWNGGGKLERLEEVDGITGSQVDEIGDRSEEEKMERGRNVRMRHLRQKDLFEFLRSDWGELYTTHQGLRGLDLGAGNSSIVESWGIIIGS